MRLRLPIGVVVLVSALLGCAKADEPKAPARAANDAASSSADGGTVDAPALRTLPMPQQFPRVTLDAAMFDAPRAAAGR